MSLQWVEVNETGWYHEARVGKVVLGMVTKKVTGILTSKKTFYYAKSGLFHVGESCNEFSKKCNTLEEAKSFIEDTFANLVNEYQKPRLYTKA